MEEFRRAHRRMFGESNNFPQNDNYSTKVLTKEQKSTKDLLIETKSLPVMSSTTPVVKTPPTVPVKKCSFAATTNAPVVQIGTYGNNSFSNNRFVQQNHRSVIQVRRDDQKDCSVVLNTDNEDKELENKTNSRITIKVIQTKQ